MGVCPAGAKEQAVMPPGTFGGNMDTRQRLRLCRRSCTPPFDNDVIFVLETSAVGTTGEVADATGARNRGL
jgi:hypothetical protein